MANRTFLALVCTITIDLVGGIVGWAAPDFTEQLDPARQLEREAQQRQIQQQLTQPLVSSPDPAAPQSNLLSFQGCLPIQKITIAEDPKQHRTVTWLKSALPHQNLSCITAQELNEIIFQLNSRLFARGYVTSRVGVERYDTNNKLLLLRFHPGMVGRITGTSRDRWSLFPNLTGRLLRAADLEQGLEQANRLPSQKAVITLWPGDRVGDSLVKLELHQVTKPYQAYLFWDNTGNQPIGRDVIKGSFIYDNCLKLHDQLAIAASRSGYGEERSSAFTWREEIPWGYYTIGYSGNYSESQYIIAPSSEYLRLKSSKHQFNLGRSIYHSTRQLISAQSSLWLYLPQRRVGQIELYSPHLTVFEIGVHHHWYTPTWRMVTTLNYAQGTPWLGATQDPSGPPFRKASVHSQFRRYQLTSDYLWRIASHLQLKGNLQMQYATVGLPGVVQLPVLDETSGVRGWEHGSYALDEGAVTRQELVIPLALTQIFPQSWAKNITISPFVHGDLALARDKSGSDFRKFAGLGGGLKLAHPNFSAAITVTKLVRPAMVDNGWVCLLEFQQKVL